MQLVFEFCADDATAAIEAVRRVLGDSEYRGHAGRAGREIFAEAKLKSIASKFEDGEVDSFTAYPKSGAVRYVLVTSPMADDQPRSFYMGIYGHH